ncbi:ABC transporter ATP-binding protein [Martelella lutilitoris]|uniref:ABC transporter ATP-binding protein n=1 Tax=Martelella lutilitoris TaxID=2583532 RepID=A0A5C4JUP9_9HYPH|nr:ABC transporter ATP-binding protein [Martelella lutilitoris]TNB48891.1 ABC transporter ATP-binding protein [Martelella lutilitoris]
MQVSLSNFTKSFDGTPVIEDLNLTVRSGEMMALLGPSGCGKSTTLFAVCGIHRINKGKILFGDKDVSTLPSQKRNVGVVFQNYALYPHMSVFDNIAFPLSVRRMNKADIKREVEAIAGLAHIDNLLERKPGQLSGGQQQRVALARAIVRRPNVLLLDEPLANLDAKLRLEMRSEIRRIQLETGITAILVTHDQVEAMSMCDRVAIMDKGKILQLDRPTALYEAPVNRFVAGFLGNPPIVFAEGRIDDGALTTDDAIRLPLPKRLARRTQGERIALGIRPEHFGGNHPDTVTGAVSFVEPQGREMLFDIKLGDKTVLRSIQPVRGDVKIGDSVAWGLETEKLLAFDAAGASI